MVYVLLIIAVVSLIAFVAITMDNDQSSKAIEKLNNIISPHKRTLAVKYSQSIYKDDYGNYVFDKWENEVKYFIENVLMKDSDIYRYLTSSQADSVKVSRMHTVRELVFKVAIDESERMIDDDVNGTNNIDELTGLEFENYCVSILNQCGWDARTTRASGDQGVDIIGKLKGITVVFQCKRFSQPVGNAAVQEAIAGKTFMQAQIAAVITNSVFTTSARQLAQVANVYLLHHSELKDFELMIFPESKNE